MIGSCSGPCSRDSDGFLSGVSGEELNKSKSSGGIVLATTMVNTIMSGQILQAMTATKNSISTAAALGLHLLLNNQKSYQTVALCFQPKRDVSASPSGHQVKRFETLSCRTKNQFIWLFYLSY